MMATKMGSLNILEQDKKNSFWKKWLEGDMGSADTMGRVFEGIELEGIRIGNHHVYNKLKRNKAFKDKGKYNALIVDGHECNASYLRHCPGCLERTIHTQKGDKIQYYHRYVLAMIPFEKFPFIVDIEEQRKGEDEVAAAVRLIKRILKDYPRAFDIVAADGLYLRSNFFKLLLDKGKEVIAVLKDERRDLIKDARGLFEQEKGFVEISGNVKREMWDIEDFTSWDSFQGKVRVVRSLETKTIRRQLTGEEESETADWIWATTLSQEKASTKEIVGIGHDRWLVENKAFNEMVNHWHADHVYKHHPNAIIAFVLTLILVINLFRAFVNLNIKQEIRNKYSDLYFANLMFAGLYENTFQEVPP